MSPNAYFPGAGTPSSPGQKLPFTVADIAAIRASRVLASSRDRALFELAISSALRASDLLALTVGDLTDSTGAVLTGAAARQRKTGKPVKFNVSAAARAAIREHIDANALPPHAPLFFAHRRHHARPLSREAFRHMVKAWADAAGHRDTSRYAGHTTRRTLAVSIYQRTQNVAAVSRVLGHSSLRHTITYLGVDDDAALAIARECEL